MSAFCANVYAMEERDLDRPKWEAARDSQEAERLLLNATSDHWPEVQEFVEGL